MLKKINVAAETKTSASKSNVPVFATNSPNIIRFILAHEAFKDAEAVLKEVRGGIEELGLSKLYQHNTQNAGAPASSIKLANGDDVVMVTMQDRYSQANEDAAVGLFENLGVDANENVHFVTKTAFNDKVFLKDGEFQDDTFNQFKAGVAELAAKLGVTNPLSSSVVVAVKENFHAARWSKFTAAQQVEVQAVLKATVVVKPAA